MALNPLTGANTGYIDLAITEPFPQAGAMQANILTSTPRDPTCRHWKLSDCECAVAHACSSWLNFARTPPL